MVSHTTRQWTAKFFRCGMRCWYCYKPLSLLPGDGIQVATKDHQIPISRGGSDRIENIVPACFECNRYKGDMTEEEFRKIFRTAFTVLCSDVGYPGKNMSLTARDEPPIEVIRKENEAVSWAWQNPPDPVCQPAQRKA